MLHKAKLVRRLKEAVLEEKDLFRAGREIVCNLWDVQGRIWHGYTITGLEQIPDKGPALIIYYHGALPVDYYYLVAKISLVKNRVLHCVVDSILFKIPGLSGVLQAFSCTPVYEAQFSSHIDYNIMWKERTGFAKVAIKAGGVPIIPIFTRNIRETFRCVGFFRSFFMRLYNKLRFPILPMYGNFPVKMHTFIGKPVEYDHVNDSPEVIRDKCKAALQNLISTHQVRPGSIGRALLERFKSHTH
ncbi:Transmembrane protein 68 [Lepeophtheirus salmonis]|uniref:Transmembrane protein 68 n=1 Tax=Lepeophtheirus salmonis TaxID=72036 RepID=A0A7R8CUV1_LEPSM|nr:Transmembrane protein 68 [Lepeophtheirus salmonis]CAF2939698.1 Transmembrane protein 68 [Lepeophtheirus salmonis]